jgi:hypothetical protein
MENKQTAVEWLIEELGEYFPHEIGGIHLMVEQAKQMEKEQIESAVIFGDYRGKVQTYVSAEQYYNETYGK